MTGNEEATPTLSTPITSIGMPPDSGTPTSTTPIASTGIPLDVSTPSSSATTPDHMSNSIAVAHLSALCSMWLPSGFFNLLDDSSSESYGDSGIPTAIAASLTERYWLQ